MMVNNRHYHESRIRVLKEEKKKIDKEIQKHRDRLAGRGNSTYLVQDKEGQTMDKGIDGQGYMDSNRVNNLNCMELDRMGGMDCTHRPRG